MQVIIATSRSINQDRLYKQQQEKRLKIHFQKINNISSTRLQPLKCDLTYSNNLRKAKSAAKLFQKQQNELKLKLQNKSLLNRIVNAQPAIKTIRISKSNSKDIIIFNISSNWTTKKKQDQKIKKQNQILRKRFESLINTNIKDYKKKIQDQIKDYIKLKNKIRKIKFNKSDRSQQKSKRSASFNTLNNALNKKIQMRLPESVHVNSQGRNFKGTYKKPVKRITSEFITEFVKKVQEQTENKILDNSSTLKHSNLTQGFRNDSEDK